MGTHRYRPADRDELISLLSRSDVTPGDVDTSLITDMSGVFRKSSRKDYSGIGSWDTSHITLMTGMFDGAEFFNEDISSWDTGKVRDMKSDVRSRFIRKKAGIGGGVCFSQYG